MDYGKGADKMRKLFLFLLPIFIVFFLSSISLFGVSVTLIWDAYPITNIDGLRLERSDDGGETWVDVVGSLLPAGDTLYNDDVEPGTYLWRLKAVKGALESNAVVTGKTVRLADVEGFVVE